MTRNTKHSVAPRERADFPGLKLRIFLTWPVLITRSLLCCYLEDYWYLLLNRGFLFHWEKAGGLVFNDRGHSCSTIVFIRTEHDCTTPVRRVILLHEGGCWGLPATARTECCDGYKALSLALFLENAEIAPLLPCRGYILVSVRHRSVFRSCESR
jgi:hypothetical protein